MAAYHQMGHDTKNLVDEVSGFEGCVLSPVNEKPGRMKDVVDYLRGLTAKDIVFDPQLYYPKTERVKLKAWKYFPKEIETADIGDVSWWSAVNRLLAGDLSRLTGIKAVCSPAYVPMTFDLDYYALMRDVAEDLAKQTKLRVYATCIVRTADLSAPDRIAKIASAITSTEIDRVYIVVVSETAPRLELRDSNEIAGVMHLLRLLSQSGVTSLVGYTSTDMMLWKMAGATSCATGKFFNLRRFTFARFSDEDTGGRLIPYWIDPQLIAFIRDADIGRLRDNKKFHVPDNPFAQPILDAMKQGASWVGLSWRYYMHWFRETEGRLHGAPADAEQLIEAAEATWQALDEESRLMDEPKNDGSWLRSWRQAIARFRKWSA